MAGFQLHHDPARNARRLAQRRVVGQLQVDFPAGRGHGNPLGILNHGLVDQIVDRRRHRGLAAAYAQRLAGQQADAVMPAQDAVFHQPDAEGFGADFAPLAQQAGAVRPHIGLAQQVVADQLQPGAQRIAPSQRIEFRVGAGDGKPARGVASQEPALFVHQRETRIADGAVVETMRQRNLTDLRVSSQDIRVVFLVDPSERDDGRNIQLPGYGKARSCADETMLRTQRVAGHPEQPRRLAGRQAGHLLFRGNVVTEAELGAGSTLDRKAEAAQFL